MTYVIAEPCIDEKWASFIRVNAVFLAGGAPAVAAALAEQRG